MRDSRRRNRGGLEGIERFGLRTEQLERRLPLDSAAAHAVASPAALKASAKAALPQVSVVAPANSVPRGSDAVFTINLSAAPGLGRTIRVNYQTVNGSAVAGNQYVRTTGFVDFTGSDTTKTVPVPTVAGSTNGGKTVGYFSLQVSASGAKLGTSQASAALAPPVTGVATAFVNKSEGNSGATPFVFVVTLAGPQQSPVTVDYATADGSATVADRDYTAVSGTLTFQPGETTKTVTVLVTGDTKAESDETFTLNLSNPTGVTLDATSGIATILDDDTRTTAGGAGFQVSVDYATTLFGTVPKAVRDAAEYAAKKWASVITAGGPDVRDPDLGLIRGFRMTVSMGLLGNANGSDGQYNALANATYVKARDTGTKLPYLGITGIDPADTDFPGLKEVLLHEFGHALGIGTLWQSNKLVQGVNPATNNPIYVGANAVREYNKIFGLAGASVPVENQGGPGSVGSHWRESVLQNELMTSVAEGQGVAMPLSRITVGALQDLGYTVNYNAADPYTKPANNGGGQGGFRAPSPGQFAPVLPKFASLFSPLPDALPAPARRAAFARLARS